MPSQRKDGSLLVVQISIVCPWLLAAMLGLLWLSQARYYLWRHFSGQEDGNSNMEVMHCDDCPAASLSFSPPNTRYFLSWSCPVRQYQVVESREDFLCWCLFCHHQPLNKKTVNTTPQQTRSWTPTLRVWKEGITESRFHLTVRQSLCNSSWHHLSS